MHKLNILVACEESQQVCKEFRRIGHNAYSCDLKPASGGHPEWHFQADCLEVIANNGGRLQTGAEVRLAGRWDVLIAHPPCTYLAVSGNRWFYHPDDAHFPVAKRRPHPRFPHRAQQREEAHAFFQALLNVDVPFIAVENPVGIASTRIRKPDQVVQPYYFGDEASKKTCLWLKNLPPLAKTQVVGSGEYVEFKSGKRMPKWYVDALTEAKTPEERSAIRSKTFPGFAKAMAEQWGAYVLKNIGLLSD